MSGIIFFSFDFWKHIFSWIQYMNQYIFSKVSIDVFIDSLVKREKQMSLKKCSLLWRNILEWINRNTKSKSNRNNRQRSKSLHLCCGSPNKEKTKKQKNKCTKLNKSLTPNFKCIATLDNLEFIKRKEQNTHSFMMPLTLIFEAYNNP